MATAMGLRRRVTVNSSAGLTNQSSPSSSNKRSRSENNNSPSHGNLNSLSTSRDEPASKKSRGTSTSGAKSSCGSASSSNSGNDPSSSTSIKKGAVSKSTALKTCTTTSATSSASSSKSLASNHSGMSKKNSILSSTSWPTTTSMADPASYNAVTALNMASSQAGLCAGSLGLPSPIPYMSTSMATFVGTATNLGKSSAMSYLDISNMTAGGGSGALNPNPNVGMKPTGYSNGNGSIHDTKNSIPIPFSGVPPPPNVANHYAKSQNPSSDIPVVLPKKFQNDAMFNTYQPWVIKTYGDLAKTKTITIKKYARILRTLRGEEVNSAENSKFRFWVKSKGFHIGQPEGYDAKPADRIVGRHAVSSPGLDPPLYVPTQLPHNKALSGAEGTVPLGRVYKKVAIVENFFDIIHAVHVDLEGRPGKHAGQKRTYRTITETYAFLPREAVTRFLLGCTECQRRPRTPSPTNLASQPHNNSAITTSIASATAATGSSTAKPLSPLPGAVLPTSPVQNNAKPREASHPPESKSLFNYRHSKQHKSPTESSAVIPEKVEETRKEKEEKYNPLSISNLLKKEPASTAAANSFISSTETLSDSRRTPESDRASSRSSASSKRKRMLPEGRTPSPPPTGPLARPWSPGVDTKNTPIDYSLPITTSYLKHQQRLLAEKNKNATKEDSVISDLQRSHAIVEAECLAESERYSPAAGLIDTNLNLLATIQHLHCQVMLALTERLRPSMVMPTPFALPSGIPTVLPSGLPGVMMAPEFAIPSGPAQHHSCG